MSRFNICLRRFHKKLALEIDQRRLELRITDPYFKAKILKTCIVISALLLIQC